MMGLLGQDWSAGHLKEKFGLLTDPTKQMELLSNPMFNMGLGILDQNAQPGGGSPAAGIMQGLSGAQANKQQQADRERIEELRRQLAELIRMQGGGAGGPQMSPVPQPPPTGLKIPGILE